jgi:hypothetical protein
VQNKKNLKGYSKMISTIITNTLTLLYLPLVLVNYYPVYDEGCILINQRYQAVSVEIYQSTNTEGTRSSFNLWSYKNHTEHKFKLTITYRVNSDCWHREYFLLVEESYDAGREGLKFSMLVEHPPNSLVQHFIYTECLDIECLEID